MKLPILLILSLSIFACTEQKKTKPNIIIIFTDDQGYQDVGVFGSPNIKTPNLDRMADEGLQLTDFYVSMSVCSASRASLLTGQYAFANGVEGVYFPDNKGMQSTNLILPEALSTSGYRSACIGKWHLGDLPSSLPLDQGFDEYYGVPYSNDMYIGHSLQFASKVAFTQGYDLDKAKADQASVKASKNDRQRIKDLGLRNLVPLMEGNRIVEYPAEQSSLTERYFERAMSFISQTKEKPFFLYLTPAMPHVPLFASDAFEGKSEGGLYGDVIEEIDFYTGKLLDFLKEEGLDKNTLVIFTSDNGPWLGKGEESGSAFPLRDGKFSRYEGGLRVPCIMWWPGTIPATQKSNEVTSTLDLMPTILSLASAETKNLELHGYDLSEFIKNPSQITLNHPILYLDKKDVAGIRQGDWKYLRYSGERNAKKSTAPELYNLKIDIQEANNLADSNPEIVTKMESEIANLFTFGPM